MFRNLTIITTLMILFIAIAILGAMVWANTLIVGNHPGEKEFLIPWLAARTYLQYGDNPYSEPATQRAQVIYYGQLAAEGQDPLALWLPLPLEVLYFPFAFIPDYQVALAVWMTLSELGLIALGFLSIRLTGWQPSRLTLLAVLLFPSLSVFGIFGLASGSGCIFVALSFVGFLLALRAEQDELAGALLLLPFFAPRLLGLFPVFMLWWIISQRRWRVLGGLGMAFGSLLVLTVLIVPDWSRFISDWFMPFLANLLTHNQYSPGLSSVGILASWSPVLGPRIGWLLAGILAFALFMEWSADLRRTPRRFLWASALTIAAAPLLGIPVSLAGQIFLFFPLMLFLGILGERWPLPKRLGIAGISLLVIFAALWLVTIVLALGWAYLALAQALILLPPSLLLFGLYWMRWWIIRSPNPGLEMAE